MAGKIVSISKNKIKESLNMAQKGILLVAVTDIEKDTILNQMTPLKDNATDNDAILQLPYNNNTYFIGKIGVQKIVLLICGMGAVGKNSVMNKVHEAINVLSPKILIMVGIAFGLDKGKQKIGDVLISQKIIAYENQKLGKMETTPRGDESQSGTVLYDRLKNAEDWEHKISKNSKSNRHFGAILSGEKLYDNKTKRDELKRRYPDAIGGEMEGYGISSVASFKGLTEWIIIKGICDWGYDKQGKYKETNQRKAMNAAMSLCTYLLSNEAFLSSIIKPTRQAAKKRFNSYKMFYFRVFENRMSIKKLKELTGISEYRLKKLEKIDMSIEEEVIHKFPYCFDYERKSIENALNISNGGLVIKERDVASSLYKSYYDKNKGLTPTLKFLNNKKDAKIVILDFDGTIVDAHALKTTWEKIWVALGYDVKLCKELHARFDRHEFSHQKWCDITAEYFKAKMLSESIIKDIAKGFEIVPGFQETIQKLKKCNVKLFIVSGSIREIIVEILHELVSDFESIDANRFVFNENGVLERIIGTEFDFEGKAERIKKISSEYNISVDEILFIGNSFNDAHVYKSGARTLCVNPTKTNSHNQIYWHDSIDEMKDFTEIIPYVFPNQANGNSFI